MEGIFMRRWVNRLELRARRYAVKNLMTYVVGGMALVFMLNMLGFPASSWLMLVRSRIFQGEVWRLATFVFLPPSSSLIWVFFSLYFYWLIGNVLEMQWGSFRFNLFYLIGVVGSIVAGLLVGYGSNVYLNLSLFFAFAILFPDFEMRLFLFLPIKIKYLALLSAAFQVYTLVFGTWTDRAAILVALLNIILFFGGDLLNMVRWQASTWRTRQNFRRNYRR